MSDVDRHAERIRAVEAKLRIGTEVLRTGGGMLLTATDCADVLDALAEVTRLREERDNFERHMLEYAARCIRLEAALQEALDHESQAIGDDTWRDILHAALAAGSSSPQEAGDE